jgi:hypothetical protein
MKVYNKHSKDANAETKANLEYGEIAVAYNASNPRLLIKDSNNKIVGFPSEGTIDNKISSINGQITTINGIVTSNTTSIESLNTWTISPLTESEIKSVFA